jgi:hypothetical protein
MDENTKTQYNNIIADYLNQYDKITKQEIEYMVDNLCWHNSNKGGLNCKHFKIVNNNLYFSGNENFSGWESRIEAFKYMILETLKIYTITDCEFVIFDEDSINEMSYPKCIYNGKQVPLIVTTSVLNLFNMILCPDFTFSFIPEYDIKNNEQMCKDVVEHQNIINFKDKISQLVWRGSISHNYRDHYIKRDTIYNIENSQSNSNYRGQQGTMYKNENGLTPKQKSEYKYQLHLNGHKGTNIDGAYSSAFKWALMGKSLVFYSAPAVYREFWMHESIFRESEHYIYSTTPDELDKKYNYYRNNDEESEKIATNGFIFFSKYLLDYNNIKYYMQQLLNEYAKKIDYKVTLNDNDKLITCIKYCEYLEN